VKSCHQLLLSQDQRLKMFQNQYHYPVMDMYAVLVRFVQEKAGLSQWGLSQGFGVIQKIVGLSKWFGVIHPYCLSFNQLESKISH